ncbi:histone-like nucleoid-structuring protein Lsr2 [Curtobacterium caseinilyticum]|uniref:Lsr2 family protein n=1 Tax=Curtobacterium caseinilyticum TaxID=3055137 RepID=A0ABT7TLN7_9MICO|nr:Lsr2 family protein [Curtobacterium caseinilyticum]MDM7890498.1 Lsr2 family protein [Curtobacterium caseinilyticum]
MAQKVTVQLVDDLDDSPIAAGEGRTVEFAFDGSNYEIDLSDDNVDKFREAISDYVAAARKVSGRRSGGSSNGGAQKSAPKRGNSEELAKIREWAKENGYEVSSRGRISTQVQEAYAAAH